jgi:CheY-like chemotaxis protein
MLDSSQTGWKEPLRILCADDDESVATVIKYALEVNGYFVEFAVDGLVAFGRAVADLNFFALIIADHHMPGLSGLQLVEKLREARFPGGIIVHSSDLREEDRRAYGAFAVDHILVKPVLLAKLLEAVRGSGATTL